jgi:hypothetical protein
MARPIPNFDEALLRAELHEQFRNAPDTVTLDAEQAAFFIGSSPKTMERWRLKKQPPYPVGMNSEGKSGVAVRYRVVVLQEFIRSSQVDPKALEKSLGINLGKNAAASNAGTHHRIVQGMRQSTIGWVNVKSVEADEVTEPFFIDGNGLVVAYGWEDDVSTIAERILSQTGRIDFLPWDQALAKVWQDEERRLSWLVHADNVAPGLRTVVESLRQARLAAV